MQYKINCSHCNTINIFDESKLNNNKKSKNNILFQIFKNYYTRT